jgi:hypothetical protein
MEKPVVSLFPICTTQEIVVIQNIQYICAGRLAMCDFHTGGRRG